MVLKRLKEILNSIYHFILFQKDMRAAQILGTEIVNYIRKNGVIVELSADEKFLALNEMVNALVSKNIIEKQDAKEILQNLIWREEYMSTGFDWIAFPHEKIYGLDNFIVAIGRSKYGIDWESPDSDLTHIVFLNIYSEFSEIEHVQVMACAARNFNVEDLSEWLELDFDSILHKIGKWY